MTIAFTLPNGMVKVISEPGDVVFYVQGMQNALRYHRDPANASRPSCTCREGHAATWCAHKIAAEKHLRTVGGI